MRAPIAAATGSSPLARGTPRRSAVSARMSAVHPRSRGEHWLARGDLPDHCGSSPLARGTRPRLRRGRLPLRFIPARAGNTPADIVVDRVPPVHPRSRGEHDLGGSDGSVFIGSSPLARGTLRPVHPGRRRRRFIPARAGNTLRRLRAAAPRPVHPRSRGEHAVRDIATDAAAGSSPLARGTLAGGRELGDQQRFIPARAGNTTRETPP